MHIEGGRTNTQQNVDFTPTVKLPECDAITVLTRNGNSANI